MRTIYKERTQSNKLIKIWYGVRSRTSNPNNKDYPRYGGRGIKLSKEWEDYENFRVWSLENGYKEGLTLDRIDNDKGYQPDNCQWLTKEEHGRKSYIDNPTPIPRYSKETYRKWSIEAHRRDPTLKQRQIRYRKDAASNIKLSQERYDELKNRKNNDPKWKENWRDYYEEFAPAMNERYFRYEILYKM